MTSRFGALVRQARLRAGLSQEELAERATLGVRTVRGLESDDRRNPQRGTVNQLADALGLTAAERAELLSAAGSPDPPSAVRIRRSALGAHDPVIEVADLLARASHSLLRREEEREPVSLPVTWRPVPPVLVDSHADISVVRPVLRRGRPDELAELYRRIPSGRLVVLGKAGSGKTHVVTRLALGMLDLRAPDDPVPVIFSLRSWNPTTDALRAWLVAQLERDHPALARNAVAHALVAAGLVLPVLDGFDEIPDALRRAALAALSNTDTPLVLTSRRDEYAAATSTAHALREATAVELADLTAEDLADYFPRATADRPGGGLLWEPVLAELRAQPRGPLATALATPLMAGLAATIYRTSDRDPAELLDPRRFHSAEAVSGHLLGSFVPAVYGSGGRRPRRWGAHDAVRWLGHLARRMDDLGVRDLAWWQLGSAGSPLSRGAAIGVVVTLVFGVAGAVVGWWGARPLDGLPAAFAVGLVFGLAHGVGGAAVRPSRVALRLPSPRSRLTRKLLLSRFMVGVALGALLWPAGGLDRDPVTALVMMFSGGIVGMCTTVVEAPLDPGTAASPSASLTAGRWTAVVPVLMIGLLFGVAVGLVRGPRDGVVLGLAGALGFALTTRGQWLVVARVWLPLTRRLPWSVITFLDDACRRGVLRQVGAVYQFRHHQLRGHLAQAARTRRDAPRRPPRFGRTPGAAARLPLPIGASGLAIAIVLSLAAARPFLAAWGLDAADAAAFVTTVVLLTSGQLLIQQVTLRLTPTAVDERGLHPIARRARVAARERDLRWTAEHRAPLSAEPARWNRPREWEDTGEDFDVIPRRGLLIGSSAVDTAVDVARTCGVVVDALWPRLAHVVPPAVRRRITWLDVGIAFFRVVLAGALAATAVLAATGWLAFATIPVVVLVLVVPVVRTLVSDVYLARADAADAYRPALLRALHLPPPATHDGLIALGDRLMGSRSPADQDGPVEWVNDGGEPARDIGADELRQVTERLGDMVRKDVDRLHDRLTDVLHRVSESERDVEALADRVADRASAALDARVAREFDELRSRLGDELAKVVETAMTGPELVDFAGYLVVELAAGGGVARAGAGVVTARPGEVVTLVVSVVADEVAKDAVPDRLTTSEAFLALETVQVEGGRTEPAATFDLIADSATMNARPHRVPVLVSQPRGEHQETIALAVPETEDRHEVWLQLYQAGRLVQAIAVTVDTRAGTG